MNKLNFSYTEDSVAAIVTTFNPNLDRFKKNLRDYAYQFDLIIICDNSTLVDKQVALISLKREINNVVVLQMKGNVGIAAAQNIGIHYAINQGFQYFLEIDQYSSLPDNYVDKIRKSFLSSVEVGSRIAGIGSLPIRADGFVYGDYERNSGIIPVDKALSSGFFFSKKSFDIIGDKDETLFIDYVDWEWCWRARFVGFEIFIDTNIHMLHLLGEGHLKLLFLNVGIPAPIRHYYQYRNSLRLFFYKHVPFKWKLERAFINMFKMIIYSLCFKDSQVRRHFILMGLKAAIQKKVGKIDTDFTGDLK